MGAELEAVGVRDGARKRYGAIRELRRHDLIDGVSFEARMHVGNSVFCAFDVLDDDRVLEQGRNPAADAGAGFGFFREQPGERFVVRAQYEGARKQIDAEVGDDGYDSETFSLKCRVVLQKGQKLCREKNWALESVV